MKKRRFSKKKGKVLFQQKIFQNNGKIYYQKDIEYFASKYSLIESFHGIWMNYSVLKAGNEPQKKL